MRHWREASALLLAVFFILLKCKPELDPLPRSPFASDLAYYLILPAIALFILRLEPAKAGLQTGATKSHLKYVTAGLLVATPLILYGATLQQFQSYYPILPWARLSPVHLLAYEAIIFILMLCTEFFFRGFVMGALRPLGMEAAVLIQNIPYTLVHIGKPPLEIPASFLGGILFGWVDYRANSILPSLILHFCFNLLLDLFLLAAVGFISRIPRLNCEKQARGENILRDSRHP